MFIQVFYRLSEIKTNSITTAILINIFGFDKKFSVRHKQFRSNKCKFH